MWFERKPRRVPRARAQNGCGFNANRAKYFPRNSQNYDFHENTTPRKIPYTAFNPLRACVARVTVLGSACVRVSVKLHLTYGASVHPENVVTYSAGNEGQNICGDLLGTTAFKSYAAKHERKSQYAN